MAHSISFNNLSRKFDDIYEMQPSDLGQKQLTWTYKFITSRLKSMPFMYIIPLACALSLALYLLFGQLVIKLVSLLQHGL